jgi:hypothetical protein
LFRIADLTNPILQPWTPEALRKVNARAVRATHPQGTAMMLDMYGTPRGPALHVVERYRSLGYICPVYSIILLNVYCSHRSTFRISAAAMPHVS